MQDDPTPSSTAGDESCVIMGRCVDYTHYNDHNCFRISIHARPEARIGRTMAQYGLSREDARRQVQNTDLARATFTDIHRSGIQRPEILPPLGGQRHAGNRSQRGANHGDHPHVVRCARHPSALYNFITGTEKAGTRFGVPAFSIVWIRWGYGCSLPGTSAAPEAESDRSPRCRPWTNRSPPPCRS